MRLRRTSVWCAMGMVLGGVCALAPAADAQPSPSVRGASSPRSDSRAGPAAVCYEQTDHDASGSIISQNWEPSYDVYDDQAADDFVLSKPCRRPIIDIDGSYGEGPGTAESFNVTVYRARKHGPGQVVRYFEDVAYVDTCQDMGCPQIRLGKKLKAGHWWISVQANLSYTETSTMWSWWSNLTVRGTEARWRNPADGFQTGCTTYTDLVTCLGPGTGIGGDLSFSINSL